MAGGKKKTSEQRMQSAVDKIAAAVKQSPSKGQSKRKRKSKNGGVALGSGQGLGIVNPGNAVVSLQTRYSVTNVGVEGDIRITGSEVVGLAGNVPAGYMNFVCDLNPMSWNGTRVAAMAKLFEKYRFDSVRVTYIPSVASTTNGLIYMYYDRDVSDAPIPGVTAAANITRMMGNQRAAVGQLWRPLVMDYRKGTDEPTYYVNPVNAGPDQRLTTQAIVYAYQSVAVGSSAGIFKIDYSLNLYTPTGPISSQLGSVTAPGWIYSTVTVAGTTAGTAPNITSTFFNTLTSAASAIFQVLLQEPLLAANFVFGRASATTTIAAYAPIFIRNYGGTYLAWDSLDEAVAANTNTSLTTGNGGIANIVSNGWMKIAAVMSNEAYGDATT